VFFVVCTFNNIMFFIAFMLHRKQNLTYIDLAYINTYTENYLRLVESTVEDGVLQQLNCLIPCMCSPEVVIGCVRDV